MSRVKGNFITESDGSLSLNNDMDSLTSEQQAVVDLLLKLIENGYNFEFDDANVHPDKLAKFYSNAINNFDFTNPDVSFLNTRNNTNNDPAQGAMNLTLILFGMPIPRQVFEACTKTQMNNVKKIIGLLIKENFFDKFPSFDFTTAFSDISTNKETRKCYICGNHIGGFSNELEHVLPFAFATQFMAIIPKGFPSKVYYKKDANPPGLYDGQNQMLFNDLQLVLLCLELRDSHQCCNQAKENLLFLKNDDARNWIVDEKLLVNYLNNLYVGQPVYDHIGNLDKKGCDNNFLKMIKKQKTQQFVRERKEHITDNYLKPMADIMNEMIRQDGGMHHLTRLANAGIAYFDPEFFNEFVKQGFDNDKYMRVYLPVTKQTLFNHIVTSLLKQTEIKELVTAVKNEIENNSEFDFLNTFINDIKNDTRTARNRLKTFIGNKINNDKLLLFAIQFYAAVYVNANANANAIDENNTSYLDKTYINDIATNKKIISDEIKKIFIYLMDNDPEIILQKSDKQNSVLIIDVYVHNTAQIEPRDASIPIVVWMLQKYHNTIIMSQEFAKQIQEQDNDVAQNLITIKQNNDVAQSLITMMSELLTDYPEEPKIGFAEENEIDAGLDVLENKIRYDDDNNSTSTEDSLKTSANTYYRETTHGASLLGMLKHITPRPVLNELDVKYDDVVMSQLSQPDYRERSRENSPKRRGRGRGRETNPNERRYYAGSIQNSSKKRFNFRANTKNNYSALSKVITIKKNNKTKKSRKKKNKTKKFYKKKKNKRQTKKR